MARTHYELGIRLKRRVFLSMPSLRQASVAAVLVAVLGGGYAGMVPGLGAIAGLGQAHESEDARSQRRLNQYGLAKAAKATSRLRVRPAVVVVPTATPSAVKPTVSTPLVIDVPQAHATDVAAITDAPDSNTVAGSQSVSQLAADDTATNTTPQQGAPLPAVVANQPITVSAVVSLPQITSVIPALTGLADPAKKDAAMQLVSSAENSSQDWKTQYAYIEDIDDGRGYTGGIIGFCSGTGDMLELIQYYTKLEPGNALAKYIPALQKLDGSDSHSGLDPNFVGDWKTAAKDPLFQQAQNDERDRVYFNPAVSQAKSDGLRTLGQFIYYDALVMHGPGNDSDSFGGIRAAAMKSAKTPAQGGDETAYLNAFLDARVAAMKKEEAHSDTSRVETAQRVFLKAGNFDMNLPLTWKVYGDSYSIK